MHLSESSALAFTSEAKLLQPHTNTRSEVHVLHTTIRTTILQPNPISTYQQHDTRIDDNNLKYVYVSHVNIILANDPISDNNHSNAKWTSQQVSLQNWTSHANSEYDWKKFTHTRESKDNMQATLTKTIQPHLRREVTVLCWLMTVNSSMPATAAGPRSPFTRIYWGRRPRMTSRILIAKYLLLHLWIN